MFVHYRTKGFFLRKIDRGESDQLFTFYAKDFGKIEVLGRAIRKIKSKLRSGADLFYFSEIEFIQGKSYKTLTDAILIEKFSGQKGSVKKLAMAHRIAELCDKFIKGGEPDRGIWQLLKITFRRLSDQEPAGPGFLLIYYFLWNLISLLGYQPEFYSCFSCQKKIALGSFYFSPVNGGMICSDCLTKETRKKSFLASDYRTINADTIKILRLILNQDWSTVSRLNIKPFHQKQLKIVSEYFLSTVPARYF